MKPYYLLLMLSLKQMFCPLLLWRNLPWRFVCQLCYSDLIKTVPLFFPGGRHSNNMESNDTESTKQEMSSCQQKCMLFMRCCPCHLSWEQRGDKNIIYLIGKISSFRFCKTPTWSSTLISYLISPFYSGPHSSTQESSSIAI